MINNNNLFNKTENVLTRKIFNVEIFYIMCFLLALIKLWLISGDEIIARSGGHDQLWHILAAERGYWFGKSYDYMMYIHLPVYALWIKLVSFTGIPLRIAIELLFIVSGFSFVLALSRSGISKIICIICYGLIIFHPESFQLFNETLAETLYAPILLLTLAASIMLWIKREERGRIKYAVFVGIFMSLLWHIRKENVLIILFLMLLLFLASLMSWREKKGRLVLYRQLGVMVMVPFLIIISVSLAIKTVNYLKFGLFVSTEMDAPGYVAAYRALQRIKPAPSVRFVPVTQKTRVSAYSVSPSFQEMAFILDDESHGFARVTFDVMGIPNEIAAGWFYWALKDAANALGHHQTARDANEYFQRIADEINRAIDDGRLPGRKVFISFLDPDMSNYLPYLPESFSEIWRIFISTSKSATDRVDHILPPGVLEAYNTIAHRRPALTSHVVSTIQGFFIPGSGKMKQILVQGENGEILAVTDLFYSRPDVDKFLSARGIKNIQAVTGFDLTNASSIQNPDATQLVFIADDKNKIIVPLKNLKVHELMGTATTNLSNQIVFCIESFLQEKIPTIKDTIQGFIWLIYGRIVEYLSLICVIAGLILIKVQRSVDLKENIYPILFILLFIVLSRVAFFTLLDASSWPVSSRYLFPVMPVYSCFLVIFIYHSANVAKLWYMTKSSS